MCRAGYRELIVYKYIVVHPKNTVEKFGFGGKKKGVSGNMKLSNFVAIKLRHNKFTYMTGIKV